MEPFEIFIYIIGLGFSFIIGFVSLWWKYEWGRKSLRDQKLLEGKIEIYDALYHNLAELREIAVKFVVKTQTGTQEEVNKIVERHSNLSYEFEGAISLLKLYSNEEIYKLFDGIRLIEYRKNIIFEKTPDIDLDIDISKINILIDEFNVEENKLSEAIRRDLEYK